MWSNGLTSHRAHPFVSNRQWNRMKRDNYMLLIAHFARFLIGITGENGSGTRWTWHINYIDLTFQVRMQKEDTYSGYNPQAICFINCHVIWKQGSQQRQLRAECHIFICLFNKSWQLINRGATAFSSWGWVEEVELSVSVLLAPPIARAGRRFQVVLHAI
jgi:hypothetical protein